MADEDKTTPRILGASTGRTILHLAIASIIVGAVFSFFGLGPREFWRGVFSSVRGVISAIGENVGEVIATLGAYLFIGAAIVIPIWLIARLLSGRK